MSGDSRPGARPDEPTVRIAKAVGAPSPNAARRRRLIVTLVVSVLLVVAAVVGLTAYGVMQMFRVIERAQYPRILTSNNPAATIRIPGGWTEVTDLSPEAVFQARSADQQTYLIVTETPKQDLKDGMTLEGFADLALGWTKEGLEEPKIGDPAFMDVGGRSFIEHKIEGLVDQQKSVIIQAATEDDSRFYSIQLGTPPSEYFEVSGDIGRIMASFKLPTASRPADRK